MKVLVTGASGMLGRATAQLLVERGHDVRVMQRRSSGLELDEVLGDVADREACRDAVDGCDAAIHLAAKVSVVGRYREFERSNVQGTQLLLQEAQRAGVARFVFVSSPSVAHAGQPLVGVDAAPADPRRARGSYSRSKAAAERLALRARAPGFAVVAVRPHLVWGPGDTQLVERIAQRARTGRLVLINGGHALIDTTYVDNAASALVAALDRAPDVSGQAFVVSNGEPRTVRELLTRICIALDVPPPTRSVPVTVATSVGSAVEAAWRWRADDDPPLTRFLVEQLSTAHWFNQRRTREALHWTPHIDLATGFARLATGR